MNTSDVAEDEKPEFTDLLFLSLFFHPSVFGFILVGFILSHAQFVRY